MFNRSQVSENSLLLDRLFDIPEDSQQMTSDELSEGNDDDVPDIVSSDEPIMISDESDFHQNRTNPALVSSISSISDRRTSLNDLEGNDLACSSSIPRAKKRKTEST